jgi:sterol desaturase/sphingolipid hydroxylase (fatty acid hydroxylase superfamily)
VLGFSAQAIALAATIKGVCLAFQHGDVDLRHRLLNYVFATNSVHRWHHSDRAQEGNHNYGSVFSFYDIVFGTFLLPSESREPASMGLFDAAHYPRHQVARATCAPWCWQRCVQRADTQR